MNCSRLRQHGRAPVLALVIAVAAIAVVAMFVSSTILFDRSILQPIPGAYTGAPTAPASSPDAPVAADSGAAPPSQLQ
jgi:hypothetical protein